MKYTKLTMLQDIQVGLQFTLQLSKINYFGARELNHQ